jgi:hypothetical protein
LDSYSKEEELLQGIQNGPLGEKTIIFSQFTSLLDPLLTSALDDTTGDLDSPRPSATAKKRSYCREFKTALLERRRSFSVHSLLSLIHF